MILASAILLAVVALPAFPSSEPLAADTACQKLISPPDGDTLPDDARKQSPLDSVTFTVGGKAVKVCYGRPSLRGRRMLGNPKRIPYGRLWRTGANEPTIFFTPIPLSIAGLHVPAGKYSLYTVPGKREWEIVVNRSTSQWGFEGYSYTDKVRAQEMDHVKVKSERLQQPIETLTIRAEPASGDATALLLEWEYTRVRIPIAVGR